MGRRKTRIEPRYKTDKVLTEFLDPKTDSKIFDGGTVDISRTCACVNHNSPDKVQENAEFDLVFKPHSEEIIRKKVRVQRLGIDGIPTCVVKFSNPLTYSQIHAMVLKNPSRKGEPDHLFEMAKSDVTAVRDELRAIETCRGHIFVGTMAAIGAASMTTALIVSRATNNHLDYLMMGVLVTAFMLLVGILATVEKARAINLRRAFLRTISDYIRNGQAPPGYRGWSVLKKLHSACGVRRKADPPECTLELRTREQSSNQRHEGCMSNTCWTLGDFEMRGQNKHFSLIPGMFESFTSFTGTVYIASYLIVAYAITFIAGIRTDIVGLEAILSFVAGVVIGTVITYYSPLLLKWKPTTDSRDLDATETIWKIVRVVSRIGLLILVVVLLTSFFLNTTIFYSHVLLFGWGLTLSWLGVFLLNQLAKVRKGIYSAESLNAGWRHVFLNCQHDFRQQDAVALDAEYREWMNTAQGQRRLF